MAPMYYRNANCALVAYDITQESSLDRAKSWIQELQKQASADIVVALVGNKLDLEAERKVSTKEAKEYADELGLIFKEISAKTGEGIKDVFHSIASKLPVEEKLNSATKRRRNIDLNRPSTNNQESCSC